MTVDFCRIALFIIAVLILYKLVTEIEAVKLLSTDPCRLCENKTGAICIYRDVNELQETRVVYPELNISKWLTKNES